jgi:hypothetical protein
VQRAAVSGQRSAKVYHLLSPLATTTRLKDKAQAATPLSGKGRLSWAVAVFEAWCFSADDVPTVARTCHHYAGHRHPCDDATIGSGVSRPNTKIFVRSPHGTIIEHRLV